MKDTLQVYKPDRLKPGRARHLPFRPGKVETNLPLRGFGGVHPRTPGTQRVEILYKLPAE